MNNKPKIVSSTNGLVAKNIRKSISNKQIVRDVSLKIERGTTIGLLGANGAGKTTLMTVIMGLLNCDSGEIILDDKNITSLPMYKRARYGLGYLPQQRSIFRGLSVEDNLLAILETKKYSKEKRETLLEELLTEFSLTHLRSAFPSMLSGGESRRCEIARALCSEPSIILFDEPLSAVDPLAIEDIKRLIKQLNTKNIACLITDHNARACLDICDFLECTFKEYKSREEYLSDIVESHDTHTDSSDSDSDNEEEADEENIVVEWETSTKKLKGVIGVMKYGDEQNITYKYVYPKLGQNLVDAEEEAKKLALEEGYEDAITFDYWWLEVKSCIEVFRDIIWFRKVFPEFEKFWEEVLRVRSIGKLEEPDAELTLSDDDLESFNNKKGVFDDNNISLVVEDPDASSVSEECVLNSD